MNADCAAPFRVAARPQLPAVLRRPAASRSAARGCRPSRSAGWSCSLSHNSGFAVGLAIALQFVPTLLFGVWGGVIADRFDKRTVLLVHAGRDGRRRGDCSRSSTSPTWSQLWMLYVIVFAFGLALAVDNPTRQSFVLRAGPARPTLPNAIGLNSAIFQAGAHRRPRARRRADRGRRHRRLLRAQRGVVRVHHRRAADDAHRRAAPRRAARRARRARSATACATCGSTPELRSTLLLTLIVGTFAINSPVVLPLLAKVTFDGERRRLQLDDDRRWARARSSARSCVANRPRPAATCSFVTGLAFGVAICVASLAPTLGALHRSPRARRRRADRVPRHLQLAAAARAPTRSMRGRVMAVYTITLLGSTPIGGPLVGWISEAFGPRWGLAVGGIATIVGVARVRHRVRPRAAPRRRRRIDAGRARRDRARDRRRVDPRCRQVTLRWLGDVVDAAGRAARRPPAPGRGRRRAQRRCSRSAGRCRRRPTTTPRARCRWGR